MSMEITRAITVRQPWAALLAEGHKRYETRGYQPRCVVPGDRLAIHAGVTAIDVELADHWPWSRARRLTFGAIIATATLEGAYPVEHLATAVDEYELRVGDWSEGRYAWHLTDVRPLADPIPCRGALGLWEIPEDVRELLSRSPEGEAASDA